MKALKLFLVIVGCATFASAQRLPNLPTKPTPEFESPSFCPAVGLTSSDRNDPDLNKAKNRIDDANKYFPVDFDEVKNLERPDGVKKQSVANGLRRQGMRWRSPKESPFN